MRVLLVAGGLVVVGLAGCAGTESLEPRPFSTFDADFTFRAEVICPEGSAQREGSFSLHLRQPRQILDRFGSHVQAYPLYLEEDAPATYEDPYEPVPASLVNRTYFLDGALRYLRLDGAQEDGRHLHVAGLGFHVSWLGWGSIAPLGIGLPSVRESAPFYYVQGMETPLEVEVDGQRWSLAAGSRLPIDTFSDADGKYWFADGDWIPYRIEMRLEYSRVWLPWHAEALADIQPREPRDCHVDYVIQRTSVTVGEPLERIDIARRKSIGEARPYEYKVVPGEGEEVLSMGVTSLDAVDEMIEREPAVRDALENGCVQWFSFFVGGAYRVLVGGVAVPVFDHDQVAFQLGVQVGEQYTSWEIRYYKGAWSDVVPAPVGPLLFPDGWERFERRADMSRSTCPDAMPAGNLVPSEFMRRGYALPTYESGFPCGIMLERYSLDVTGTDKHEKVGGVFWAPLSQVNQQYGWVEWNFAGPYEIAMDVTDLGWQWISVSEEDMRQLDQGAADRPLPDEPFPDLGSAPLRCVPYGSD